MDTTRMVAVDLGASGGKLFAGEFADGAFAMQEIHRFEHDGVDFHIADRDGQLAQRTVWDDVFIHRNIVTGLQNYRRDVGDRLDSIGIDTWGADGNVMSPDGDMLGKIYCYRDHRLDHMVDEVKARMDPERIYAITGIHFQPFNVSNQLLWFATRRKDLLQPGCFFLPVSSLFYYYLGGCRQVDSSWASVTQLMDAREKTWSAEILDALGIPAAIMPAIVAPGTVVGELLAPLAESVGLNPAKLIAVGAHDTASAFAAAPVANPDDALIISSGTWSLVGKLIPAPITNAAAMAANISNEGGIGNIRCLKNCMGTWLVQELRRVWAVVDGEETTWDDIVNLAGSADPFGVLVDPDDPSFYNPDNMEEAIAAFCARTGQERPESRGAAVRAVYESLALKYRMVNEQICDVSGTATQVVNIVGGGSRNELLNRFAANALGLPVQAGPVEATAVGNFMVQAMGLGLIDSMPAAQPIIQAAFPIKTFEPEDPAPWAEAYERFKGLCGA